MAVTAFGRRLMRTTGAVATVGNDLTSTIGPVDVDCTISSITYIPNTTITGAATNNRTISVVNKGQSGVGTTSIASLNFGNGTNATAYDEKALTNSATAADLDCVAGDVLAFVSTHIGTGIADPGGVVVVTYAPKTA